MTLMMPYGWTAVLAVVNLQDFMDALDLAECLGAVVPAGEKRHIDRSFVGEH